MRTSTSLSLLALSTLLSVSTRAAAARPGEAPTLRHTFNVLGGYTIVGNTLAQDCRNVLPLPGPSTVAGCGTNTNDTGSDVFWAISSGSPGVNLASTTITPTTASARVQLTLPPAVTVRHARLYWGATADSGTPDGKLGGARLDRSGNAGVAIAAERTWSVSRPGGSFVWYQSTADVTATVALWGTGAYDLSGVALRDVRNEDNDSTFAGFSLVVVYDDPSAAAAPQNITLFDGFDVVENGTSNDTVLTGFAAPKPVTSASLGVIAYEGDDGLASDSLSLEGVVLGNTLNPQKNFFNGSRTRFDTAVSDALDAPVLTGNPDSMSGIDLDIVDVTGALVGGSTTAKLAPRSSVESFVIGAYVLGITVPGPQLDTIKSADRSPARYLPGDIVTYEITVTNTGGGPAVAPNIRDIVPAGLTYHGNLTLFRGAPEAQIALSDAVDADVGQYDPVTKGVVVQDVAGQILPGQQWIIRFEAKVNADALGPIDNQANVRAKALVEGTGQPPVTSDSHPKNGVGPTTIIVDACDDDGDCKPGTCDLAASPHVCVGGAAGAGGSAGTGGAAGSGGEAGAAGSAGSGGNAGAAGTSGGAGAGGEPTSGGQAGVAGQSGQAGFAGDAGASGVAGTGNVAGASGTAGKSGASGTGGTGGASGTGGKGGGSGTGGKAGAAGQPTAGTGGGAGNGGASGKAGAGNAGTSGNAGQTGTAGAPGLAEDDRFQGSGISCAVEARPNRAGRFGGFLAPLALALAWLRRRGSRS